MPSALGRSSLGVSFIDDLFESSDDGDDDDDPSAAAIAVANSRRALKGTYEGSTFSKGVVNRRIGEATRGRTGTGAMTRRGGGSDGRAGKRSGSSGYPPPGSRRVETGVDVSVSTTVGSVADSLLDWFS